MIPYRGQAAHEARGDRKGIHRREPCVAGLMLATVQDSPLT